MVLDFSEAGYVHINQTGMIQEIAKSPGVHNLEAAVGAAVKKPKTPSHDKLFQHSEDSAPLPADLAKELHSITAKILFMANCGRCNHVHILYDEASTGSNYRGRKEATESYLLPARDCETGLWP